MKMLRRARAVLAVEIEQLVGVRRRLDRGFSRAARLLQACLRRGGKIVVAGVGKSYHVGQKISATLASTGSTSVALHPSQAMHGDMGVFCRHDALLALSCSGASGELLELLPVVRRQGVRIVAMTADRDSLLARHSHAVIRIAVAREACPFNLAPTASTTAMMAVGDALAIVLLEARGFHREDFARLHPGGAIGRTLLLKAGDLMRHGARLARVRQNARVRTAMMAMTRARAGSAAVVDGRNRLLGVFTDGDLRRLLARNTRALEEPLARVMTRAPVTISTAAPAGEVLKLFEEHAIDDLLVVDGRGRLAGSIDVQDLPKFKIL